MRILCFIVATKFQDGGVMAVMFPKISGSNLEGRKFNLPADFEGDLNIVFIPFQQWQQRWVDGWMPFAKTLVGTLPSVRVYELPTLPQFSTIQRWWLDNGMRIGIPNRKVREITITLYTDKATFRNTLNMPTENTIYVLVVRRDGTVVWRSEGEFSEAKGRELKRSLTEKIVL